MGHGGYGGLGPGQFRRLSRGGCSGSAAKPIHPALAADGRHLQTDVLTSLGVLLGLALVHTTGQAVVGFGRRRSASRF